MSGQPVNLRPYGDGMSSHGAAQGSMEEQAIARARHKLESVRSGRGGDRPAGTDVAAVVPAAILALIVGGPLLLLGGALAFEKDGFIGTIIFGGLGLLICAIPVLAFVQSKPTTPKRALQNFYKALARKRHKRARALTVQADLDGFPRHQPRIQNLGNPSGYPRPLGDETGFSSYWNELLLSHPSPYCLAKVSKVRETPIGHDVMMVDFELRLMMNTRLWLLLIFIALLLAVLVDLATRKTVTVQMRKLLVKVGDEWHVFSAEWQGYEEYNLDWLRART